MSLLHAPSCLPTLRREGISWRTVGSDLLLRLDFANESDEPTADDILVIEAAPLGAFIPFEPITRLTLAGFQPWERRRVEVAIPLRRLDFADDYSSGVAFESFLSQNLKVIGWWGNFGVYFESAPEEGTEVHRADSTIECGRVALMDFHVVGSDRFALEVRSSAPGWHVDALRSHAASAHDDSNLLWVSVRAPDEPGRRTTIETSFTRESDLKTIPVTFDFVTVEPES